jgi:hypothetical protein
MHANGSGWKTMNLCQVKFPHCHHPNHKTFAAIYHQLRGTGTFDPFAVNWGRARSIQTPDIEEHVLDHVEENPGVSMRQIAAELNVAQMTIWRVWHEQFLYPYQIYQVQGLNPANCPAQEILC